MTWRSRVPILQTAFLPSSLGAAMTPRLTALALPSGRRANRAPALVLFATLCCAPAWAQDTWSERATAALAEETGGREAAIADTPLTLRSEDAPAFIDTAALQPASGAQYNELTGWLTPGRPSSMGLTLGVLSSGPMNGAQASPLAYDLGVRWRSRLERRVHLDLHAWARTPQQYASQDALGMIWSREPARVGTRLEVQWKPSRTGGLIPEFGAIGVQLQGDARLLLRARHGGPMFYYRAKF